MEKLLILVEIKMTNWIFGFCERKRKFPKGKNDYCGDLPDNYARNYFSG